MFAHNANVISSSRDPVSRCRYVALAATLQPSRQDIDDLERVVEFESTYWRKLNKLNAVVGLPNAYDQATQRVDYSKK